MQNKLAGNYECRQGSWVTDPFTLSFPQTKQEYQIAIMKGQEGKIICFQIFFWNIIIFWNINNLILKSSLLIPLETLLCHFHLLEILFVRTILQYLSLSDVRLPLSMPGNLQQHFTIIFFPFFSCKVICTLGELVVGQNRPKTHTKCPQDLPAQSTATSGQRKISVSL